MPNGSTARAFAAGVLAANSIPHAYAATTRATHLTPLRGRSSGPVTNALWAGMNAAGSLALARSSNADDVMARRSFKLGVAAFSAWALASEWVTDLH